MRKNEIFGEHYVRQNTWHWDREETNEYEDLIRGVVPVVALRRRRHLCNDARVLLEQPEQRRSPNTWRFPWIG